MTSQVCFKSYWIKMVCVHTLRLFIIDYSKLKGPYVKLKKNTCSICRSFQNCLQSFLFIMIGLCVNCVKIGEKIIFWERGLLILSRFSWQLPTALSSAYVLWWPILQTLWTQIRLLPKGAVRSGLIVFASLIKSVWCAIGYTQQRQ